MMSNSYGSSGKYYSARVRIFSHNFSVTGANRPVTEAIKFIKRRLIHWGSEYKNGRYRKKHIANYFVYIDAKDEWRFPISLLEDFYQAVKAQGTSLESIEIVTEEEFSTPEIDLKYATKKTPRAQQLLFMDYLRKDEPKCKLLEARTGAGKTFMSMDAVHSKNTRVVYLVLPRFIVKAREDLKEEFDVTDKDIITIQGSNNLIKLIKDGKEDNIKAKFIIISLNTYISWLRDYIDSPMSTLKKGYKCPPTKFFQTIGANVCLIDECHMHFHAVFTITLFMHVKWSIFMSATLTNDDDFINGLYEIFYPSKFRIGKGVFDRYLKAHAVRYMIAKHRYYVTKYHGSEFYSHAAFEESILRSKDFVHSFAKMLVWCLEHKWIGLKGPKVAILYFALTDFIDAIMKVLKKLLPEYTIKRKIADDPIENAHTADIVLTTPGSLSTGHDIKNLKVVISAISIASSQTNKQLWGRLREQADGNHDYYFVYCEHIEKQIEYAAARVSLLKTEAKEIDSLAYDVLV